MERKVKDLTMHECINSFGGRRKVYYVYIDGKLIPRYYNV